jgi:hypothetical protein
MSGRINAVFGRGEYIAFNPADTTSYQTMEGEEFEYEDRDWAATGPVKPLRTNQMVRVRVVRNNSGIALLPKRIAIVKLTGTYGNQVDGYVRLTGGRGYPIDEFLPAAGVPDKALFYIVVKGPGVCLTDIAAGISIVVGDYVNSLTAASSQATTAGHVVLQDLSGATALLAAQVQNRIGAAMTARTTAETNTAILVDVGKW